MYGHVIFNIEELNMSFPRVIVINSKICFQIFKEISREEKL